MSEPDQHSSTSASGGGESGRRQLLDAGRLLLMEAAAQLAFRSLTVRAVTKRAGKSSGAFYHYWETQADFIRELMTTSLDPDDVFGVDPAMAALPAAVEQPLTFEDAVELFEMHVQHQTVGTEFPMQLLAGSMPSDSPEVEATRHVFDRYRTELSAMMSTAFGGKPLRGGVSYDQFAVMIAAIGDGASFRRRIDPEWGGPDLARQLVTAVFAAFSPDDDTSLATLEANVDRALARDR